MSEPYRTPAASSAASAGAIEAHKRITREAILLARGIRCVCHECWTGRGRHDPHGCTFEDIADLREAVEELLREDPTWLVGLPDWAQVAPSRSEDT